MIDKHKSAFTCYLEIFAVFGTVVLGAISAVFFIFLPWAIGMFTLIRYLGGY